MRFAIMVHPLRLRASALRDSFTRSLSSLVPFVPLCETAPLCVNLRTSLRASVLALCCVLFVVSAAARTVTNFNSSWEWRLDQPGAAWQAVDLPHDFQFTLPWNQSAGGNHGFKPSAAAFYRKTFAWDPAWEGQRVLLDFGGILFYG